MHVHVHVCAHFIYIIPSNHPLPNVPHAPIITLPLQGHANIIDLLLLAQADPNLPNKDRDTPLHWAASGGSA